VAACFLTLPSPCCYCVIQKIKPSKICMPLQEESKRLISAIQMESASKGSLQLELNTLHEDLAKMFSSADVLKVGAPPANCPPKERSYLLTK